MWIEEITNAKGTRYKYSERFISPQTGKRIKVSVTLNSNSTHAKKAASELLHDKYREKTKTAAQKQDERMNTLTFHEVVDEWNAYTAPMVKPETRDNHTNYTRILKKYIPATLLFIDFTPAQAESIINDMYYHRKLSFAYSSATLITIKAIMRYAKKAQYTNAITDFEEIRLKKRPATKEELEAATSKFLNKAELADCLHQLKQINKRVALAMECIALTGLRCGELLALREEDYNEAENLVHVNGTLVKIAANGDDIQRGTPKNIYSYRDVALNKRAATIIKYFLAENKKAALWSKGSYQDKGYIFTTKTGNPYNIQYINRQLRQVHINKKKLSTHIFRHTHISLLAEMGIPLKAIMKRVGHNDPKTTLSVYTHVTDTMEKELRQKIEFISV